MYLVTALLMTLAMSVTEGKICGGSICAPDIEVDCKAKDMPCANLYFYNETDDVVHIHQGTSDTMDPDFPRGVKGVVKVQTVGEYGCYTIHKKKNRKDNGYCLTGNDKIAIGPGTDYEWTVVR